ncbi:MAG: SGNH hydrolase domain-containing protein, partial [Psychromonas sp.]
VVAILYFSLNHIFVYLGIGLSVLLGFLSYNYIEKIKFQNNFENSLSYLRCKPVSMVLVVGFIGGITFITTGFQSHYPKELIIAENEALNRNPFRCDFDQKFPCYIGNKDNIKAIIVGDSHAEALMTGLTVSLDLKHSGIIALNRSGCPFILNAIKISSIGKKQDCYEENIKRLEYLDSHHTGVPVFWIARTGLYVYGHSNPIKSDEQRIYFNSQANKEKISLQEALKINLNMTIERIVVNHPVYLIKPTPEMRKNIPKTLAKNIILNKKDDLSINYELYLLRNKYIISLIDELAYSNDIQALDPIPYLCDNGRCIAQFNGRPIYSDGDHMSEYGNKLLAPMFQLAIQKHLN